MSYKALAIIIVATATAAACSGTPDTTAAAPPTPIAVTITRVSTTDLPSTFEAGGIVRARLTAAIASRVMAPVVDVRVKAGDHVRGGAPLILLDAREMTANRDRAVAAAAAAQESSVAADADVAAAEANLALARATHQRIADLAAKKSATPQELDQAIAALNGADAQRRAAQARRASAASGTDAARAASSAADAGLTYTRLTAPFDALVAERLVDPGTMATPGTPLLLLEDRSGSRLEVRIDQSRAAQVEVGQPVDFSIGGETPEAAVRTWTAAHIGEIARLDPASHAFVVKVDLPPGDTARSGSFGRVRFKTPPRAVLAIPEAALVRRGQLTFVFVVDGNDIARLRAVSPGASAGGQVEALAGVSDGDMLVVNPPPALTDGRPVQATNAVVRGDAR